MSKWMLAAGAAALAIVSPSLAQQGERGGGKKAQASQPAKGGGGGNRARAQRSGGGDRAVRVQRGGGGDRIRVERGGGGSERARAQRSGGGDRVVRAQRGNERREIRPTRQDLQRFTPDRGRERRAVRVDRGQERRAVQVDSGRGRARLAREERVRVDRGRQDRGVRAIRSDRDGRFARVDRDEGQRFDREVRRFDRDRDVIRGDGRRFAVVDRGDSIVRVRDFDRGRVRVRDIDRDDLFVRRLGYGAGGCPPGLARKGNGCLPPGQAAKLVGQPLFAATRIAALDPLPRSFRSLYWDDDDHYYRYGGGYVYRVDRDDHLIAAMIPLFGAALIGRPLQPYYVNRYYRPAYFNAFYPNSPYDCYRYGYGYVYEVDCITGLVEDVIPTYDYGYGVGQILPASYSYYNLPYQYRSYYIDDDDSYYRYAPGAIYRVDRDTALISAVVSLLAGALTVGQPLPVGYSAYNVPLAYRTTYYDRPDVWYRYNDGYIYAVDPGTRVVESVAYAIV